MIPKKRLNDELFSLVQVDKDLDIWQIVDLTSGIGVEFKKKEYKRGHLINYDDTSYTDKQNLDGAMHRIGEWLGKNAFFLCASVECADNYSQEWGRTINAIREKKGLSLNQLEKLSGVSRQQISNIESGKFSTSIESLQKVLTALNCSLALIEYEE